MALSTPPREAASLRWKVKPFPPTGYRTLSGRTTFFYPATGITPAMAMRVTGKAGPRRN
jgi:hypothetical protein